MSLDAFSVTEPNQALGTGDDLALVIEEFTGIVHGTLERVSKAAPLIPVRSVQGTSTVTNEGIGKSTISVLQKGVTPNATGENQFNQISLTIDTVVLAREYLFILDNFQKRYDVRSAIAREHGKEIAKFYDQAFFIQAAKAAATASSKYGLPGHNGGTTVTLASAGDATDPAALYQALSDMFAAMEAKDVDPVAEGVIVAVRPASYYALLNDEHIVNGEYTTAAGNVVNGVKMLAAFGVPIVSSNNVPNTNITAHPLSNTRNSNAYNGDFTKLVAVAFSPAALLAGSTIPLTSKVWFDDMSKHWVIDAYLSFGVTPDRVDLAARIVTP